MLSPTTPVGAGHRFGPRLAGGFTVLAASLLAVRLSVGQEPTAARELLSRHVLESLAHAVQPPAVAVNPMRDQRVWSRRAIMDALDRQAMAQVKSPVSQQPVAMAHTNVPERTESATPISLPSPVQPRPFATVVEAQVLLPVVNEPEVIVELPVARELPPLTPLRSDKVPANAQPVLPEPRPIQPVANAPAQLTPPAAAEPLRSVDSNRGVEQTSWERPAELPVRVPTSGAPQVNPLRSSSTITGQAIEPVQRVNPLRR